MAHWRAPGKFNASFTTPDGNTVKASGSMDPLTSVTCIELVTTDRERDPKTIEFHVPAGPRRERILDDLQQVMFAANHEIARSRSLGLAVREPKE